MAIIAAAFTSGTATSTSTPATASKVWVSGRLYIAWVLSYLSGGTAATPTGTRGSTALTQIRSDANNASTATRATAFCFLGDGTTGTMAFSSAGVSQTRFQWTIDEFQNTVITGTNGINAIVQSNSSQTNSTSLSTTLAAFADATNNAAYAFGYNQGGAAETVGAGYTGLSTQTSFFTLLDEFKLGQDTAPAMTQASANNFIFTAMEIAAAGSGGGGGGSLPGSTIVSQAVKRASIYYAPEPSPISLEAYYRERARAQREFMRKVERYGRKAA